MLRPGQSPGSAPHPALPTQRHVETDKAVVLYRDTNAWCPFCERVGHACAFAPTPHACTTVQNPSGKGICSMHRIWWPAHAYPACLALIIVGSAVRGQFAACAVSPRSRAAFADTPKGVPEPSQNGDWCYHQNRSLQ